MTDATPTALDSTAPQPSTSRAESGLRRIYMMNLARSRGHPPTALLAWIGDLGFDTLLLALPPHSGTADIEVPPPIVAAAAESGLRVHLDLRLDVANHRAPIFRHHPDWFDTPRGRIADPRDTLVSQVRLRGRQISAAAGDFVEYWTGALRRWGENGVRGYRCEPDVTISSNLWRELIVASPEFDFSIWTPGQSAETIGALPRDCFDLCFNSLAWWDFGSDCLREEISRLLPIAPVVNTVGLPTDPEREFTRFEAARRLLAVAACNGSGLLLPMGFEFGHASDLTRAGYGAEDWERLRDNAVLDLTTPVRRANHRIPARAASVPAPEIMSCEAAPVAVLFEPPAQLTLANRNLRRSARFDLASLLPKLDGKLAGFAGSVDAIRSDSIALTPGEVLVITGEPAHPIMSPVTRGNRRQRDRVLATATAASRVAIEAIEPAVDGGRFAVKRIVGERVTVEADILIDGHGKLAASLQWRAKDEADWHETPMRLVDNDRWTAHFWLERVGPYQFRIAAWPDRFATWRDEIAIKQASGLEVTLELEEGRLLLEAMAAEAPGMLDPRLTATKSRQAASRMTLLMDPETAAAVAQADTRPGQIVSHEFGVDADRRAAGFASWYELFPRGQSEDLGRHGTFQDVIRRLPAIRDMGFDVLYFPPIHPIGRINRKGRGNSLTARANDPGSPYAIGATEGGHDAIHPELGSLDDFRALRDAAAEQGLELALDFAIQCSPDHPWLRDHPEWFDWRPDGGLRYAENPPKKYEDIVNVDFYRPDAIPHLWRALRDVVAFWTKEGVRIFRVDNPHTKPFPFWEWLIADIRAAWPDTLFLAEAFTRPKAMYRLGKLGFSQSYTYFTWRNEKWEIESYLRELTGYAPRDPATRLTVGYQPPLNVPDFFRPNFFVNTPDINPTYLQHSGRAGFLIRAVLAATLSGLWGMLQGFEFCEATPIPGREEYADSDKYEIRVRPERAPGDIVDEITRLNAIRRANPALQSHIGLAFHLASNDHVLWYRKANVDRSNVVLVAVSLDPFGPQSAVVEVPLWEWGLDDGAELQVTDLIRGGTDVWYGKHRTISLDPRALPFGIWRARPRELSA